MNVQAQEKDKKQVVFDEQGQTVEEEAPALEASAEVTDDETAEVSPDAPEAPLSTAKYRIGDKFFETQEAALEYANELERVNEISDAYRQGLRESQNAPATAAIGVTPAEAAVPEVNAEELYTNPTEFLRKRDEAIEARVLTRLNQQDAQKAESDTIWREFTERHPMLADFRSEVETFVQGNLTDVRALIVTKGRPASYDFIATKIKSRFEKYASAVKPKRELKNTTVTTPAPGQGGGVTPKTQAKKPLSFAEQVRTLRKGR